MNHLRVRDERETSVDHAGTACRTSCSRLGCCARGVPELRARRGALGSPRPRRAGRPGRHAYRIQKRAVSRQWWLLLLLTAAVALVVALIVTFAARA